MNWQRFESRMKIAFLTGPITKIQSSQRSIVICEVWSKINTLQFFRSLILNILPSRSPGFLTNVSPSIFWKIKSARLRFFLPASISADCLTMTPLVFVICGYLTTNVVFTSGFGCLKLSASIAFEALNISVNSDSFFGTSGSTDMYLDAVSSCNSFD